METTLLAILRFEIDEIHSTRPFLDDIVFSIREHHYGKFLSSLPDLPFGTLNKLKFEPVVPEPIADYTKRTTFPESLAMHPVIHRLHELPIMEIIREVLQDILVVYRSGYQFPFFHNHPF